MVYVFVAPWSLPKERVPCYIIWEKNIEFTSVRIILPDNYKIDEFYNYPNEFVTKLDNEYIFSRDKLKRDGFLQVSISHNFSSKTKESKEVKVQMYDSSGTAVYTTEKLTYSVQPHIIVEAIPEEIKIEERKIIEVPLDLFYQGFGTTYITMSIRSNTGSLSFSSEIEKETFKKILLFSKYLKAKKDNLDIKQLLDEITQSFGSVENIEEFIRIVVNTMSEKLELDLKSIFEGMEDVIEQFKDENSQFRIGTVEIIDEHIAKFLADFLEKMPHDNVFLKTAQQIIEVSESISYLELKIEYKDDVDNVYPPIQKMILIDDKRTQKIPVDLIFRLNFKGGEIETW